MVYTIIKAKSEHTDEIVNLNKQFHLDMPNFIWDTKEWVSSRIENGTYYLLMEDGSIHGAMNIDKSEKEYHISAIAIRQDLHKRGLGRRLIDYGKNLSIKNKIPLFTVGSFCDYKLDKFYCKCGFTKRAELAHYQGKSLFRFFMDL